MGLLPIDRRNKSNENYELLLTSPVFSNSTTCATDSEGSYFSSVQDNSDACSLASSEYDREIALRDVDEHGGKDSGSSSRRSAFAVRAWARRDPLLVTVIAVAVGTGVALFIAFPFPTTVHVFVGAALGLTIWSFVSWTRVVFSLALASLRGTPKSLALPRWSTAHFITLVVSTAFVSYWLALGLVPAEEAVPVLGRADGSQPKYFIAANLYNSEDILPRWSREIIKLAEHLGPNNTFVSIYESNSKDRTPEMLTDFATRLDSIGVRNRILHDETRRWWPYGTSPQRIGFLANARNKALEPLQSPDASLRLPDYHQFTKVVFVNDIIFTWQAAVRLLATSIDDTPGEDGYDLACGMDFFQAGLYDTWVARDVCGTPMRLVWPYVKDPVSKQLLAQNRPFEVSSCWNGIVAFPAQPYLFDPQANKTKSVIPSHAKRGWKMVDDASYPDSRMSPAITTPIQFRTSGIEACDHSECFLFSYDLHRLYKSAERPPRIIMNPTVLTAYSPKWWAWRNVVLQIPAVQWWQRHWSHGIPLMVVDWIWEGLTRRRDYCTWSALATHAPERCPALPGATTRQWNQ